MSYSRSWCKKHGRGTATRQLVALNTASLLIIMMRRRPMATSLDQGLYPAVGLETA